MIYTLWKKAEPFQENFVQDKISETKPLKENHIQDKISGDDEKELSFVSAPKEQSIKEVTQVKKVAPVLTEATQDKHPSKNRSLLSFV